MRQFLIVGVLLAIATVECAYSKYGRTCEDIGCLSNEECVMAEDLCTIKSKGHCGTYPSCKRVKPKLASCENYVCPGTQVCQIKNKEPRCVNSGSGKTKRAVQSYNPGYNPSAPYNPSQSNQGHIYPTLPSYNQPGYSGQYNGTTYPGQQTGSNYPGQYPGQQRPPVNPLPGQQYPGQYPGQNPTLPNPPTGQYPGQYPGTQYPGTQYPGAQYPGSQYPGTQYPGTQYPGTQYPGTQYPGTRYPGTQYPGTQYPGTQYPGTQYPGVKSPSSQYPGTQYPGTYIPGTSSSGDFYRDQTKNSGGRRYKRSPQYGGSHNQTNPYGGSSGYPIGGNTYPIPPGYSSPGHSSHSGRQPSTNYPTGTNHSTAAGVQKPHSPTGSNYPGQQTGVNYPGYPSQSGSSYPNYPGQQSNNKYPSQSGSSYPNYPGQQTGSGYPSKTGTNYPGQQQGAAYPNYPGQQTGSGYPSQSGTNYPGQQQGAGYPGQQTNVQYPSGYGVAGRPASQYPQGPSSGSDFYQTQLKGAQPSHSQSGNYAKPGRTFKREVSYNYDANRYTASNQPINQNYPQYPNTYPQPGSYPTQQGYYPTGNGQYSGYPSNYPQQNVQYPNYPNQINGQYPSYSQYPTQPTNDNQIIQGIKNAWNKVTEWVKDTIFTTKKY